MSPESPTSCLSAPSQMSVISSVNSCSSRRGNQKSEEGLEECFRYGIPAYQGCIRTMRVAGRSPARPQKICKFGYSKMLASSRVVLEASVAGFGYRLSLGTPRATGECGLISDTSHFPTETLYVDFFGLLGSHLLGSMFGEGVPSFGVAWGIL